MLLFDTVSGMPGEKVTFQQRWEKGASYLPGEEGIGLGGTKVQWSGRHGIKSKEHGIRVL